MKRWWDRALSRCEGTRRQKWHKWVWRVQAGAKVNIGWNSCKRQKHAQMLRMDANRHEGWDTDTPIGTNSILWNCWLLFYGADSPTGTIENLHAHILSCLSPWIQNENVGNRLLYCANSPTGAAEELNCKCKLKCNHCMKLLANKNAFQ